MDLVSYFALRTRVHLISFSRQRYKGIRVLFGRIQGKSIEIYTIRILFATQCAIMILTHSITFVLLLAVGFTSAELKCRPEGPVLPKPTALANSATFKAAAANLTETLNAAVSGSIEAGWPVSNVSFSLAVVSADQDEPGVPIWEYHRLATANTKGTKNLNRDSQYLIGSISKVFTDYVLLKSGVDLDAPVTEFLPSLDDTKSTIQWRDVNLRMLASYLGGTPANCEQSTQINKSQY
mgnify:CR=1 FL=1